MVSDSGMADVPGREDGHSSTGRRNGSAALLRVAAVRRRQDLFPERGRRRLRVSRQANRYELLAKNDLEEHSLASYAAADGALFIRTEEHLYRIETKK